MRALVREVGQLWRIPEDDIVEPIQQLEQEDIPFPAFVRRHRPRYAEPGQLKTTLCDVMKYLIAAKEEHRWIMDLVSVMMRHLGMDHQPFPRVGPCV